MKDFIRHYNREPKPPAPSAQHAIMSLEFSNLCYRTLAQSPFQSPIPGARLF